MPVISLGLPKHDDPLVIGDDYVLPGSWQGDVKINTKNLAECLPDEPLMIEVWDLVKCWW